MNVVVQTSINTLHVSTYLFVLCLYQFKPMTYHRWTAAELKKVITMLQHPDFDSKDIQHKYSKNKNSCFPAGCADAAAEDGRHGSNFYEVNLNQWLWQFGRGKPRLGSLTIEETAKRQVAVRKALDKRGKETREGSKGDRA